MKVLRQLFTSREARSDAVFAQLAASIASRVPQTRDRASRLEGLAESITALAEFSGAMVVACDEEGWPLEYKAASLGFCDDASPLTVLAELAATLPDGDSWADVQIDQLETPDVSTVLARRIGHGKNSVGIIVVAFSGDVAKPHVLDGLEKSLRHFKWVIHDALRLEEMRCINELREMEREELGLLKEIKPQRIAERLKAVFQADAVTILVREQGELYLSATTDTELGKRTVAYNPGSGFTGSVLSAVRSIRLRNARDPEEIRLKVGAEVFENRGLKSTHPEALSRKGGGSFRFLAVPMRSSPKDDSRKVGFETRGVIRILRKEEDPAFSNAEEDALQHFADIFGLAIRSAWRWFLAEHVMEAETEAICITRTERRGFTSTPIVYADPGSEILFGLPRNQMEGMDGRKFYADGEYEKVRDLLDNAIRRNEQECGPVYVKVRRSSSSGEVIRSVQISYRLITSDLVWPRTHYTLAVIRDITEAQLQAEQHERLVTLLDKQGLAYFRADKEERTVESSPTESRLTGYTFQELKGKRREFLYASPSDRSRLLSEVNRRDGQLVRTMQRLKRKDETHFLVEGSVYLLKDEAGRKFGYEGLYEDVTDRVRLQGFLDADTQGVIKEHELFEKLKENTRFQLLFMTSVSHQLRSPLGALVEQLRNLQEGVIDATRFSKRLEYVTGQARVCALLVTNLTYMDKILRGETFEFERVNLARLAVETKVNFEHLLPEKNMEINVDTDSIRKNLAVYGHQELLRQVFVNLLDNAIKYSTPDSRIRICGRHGPQGHCFQISNHGIPIPGVERSRIFERGVRLPHAEALIPDGTGLGLWLVRKIVRAHDATIRCTNILEEGAERTAFQIFFPTKPISRSVDSRRLA